jgi:hypothetical protein
MPTPQEFFNMYSYLFGLFLLNSGWFGDGSGNAICAPRSSKAIAYHRSSQDAQLALNAQIKAGAGFLLRTDGLVDSGL